MNHTQLLNYLIEKYDLKSYLEIGVRTTEQNFDKIKCKYKFGCDPNIFGGGNIFRGTSDEYFNQKVFTKDDFELIHTNYDLIFIDGDHTASQVERDFNNSLRCLNEGGFIVLHDTCPDKEEYTKVPRETKIWFGDVYKFAMNLGQYNGIQYLTLDEDCGITVCWKVAEVQLPEIMHDHTFYAYLAFKKYKLQIITIEDLDKYLPKVKEVAR